MSFNLIDLIKEPLQDQIVGQIGSMLGVDKKQTSTALDGAIPGILSGLLHAGSSNPKVADTFINTLDRHDDSILDNLGDLFKDNNKSSSLIDFGTKALGSLLGNGGVGSLVSAIAGFSGIGKGSSKSLLGLIAPIIFGVIKRKLLGSGGLSVGNLLNLLKGQKENINKAMPAGFEDQLKQTGFFDNFKSQAAEAVREVERHTPAPQGKSLLSKLLPLIIILGALWFAYNYFIKNRASDVKTTESTTMQQTANPTQELKSILGTVTSSLGSITDVNSAKAVLPDLNNATNKLGNLASMLNKLPDEQHKSLVTTVSQAIPQLKSLIDKVAAIPGVGDIIKPVVQALVSKLALFK